MKQEGRQKPYTCDEVLKVLNLDELGFYELGAIYLHLSVCEGNCEIEVKDYLEKTKSEK